MAMEKRPYTKLKNYNYTERHDALARNVANVKAGKAIFRTPQDLMMASGYTEKSAIETLKNKQRAEGVAAVLEEIWPANEVADLLKQTTLKAKEMDKLDMVFKGIDMRMKATGDFAAQKVEHSGTVEHDHVVTLGKADYLEFKKKQLKDREYIDGEIVNTSK